YRLIHFISPDVSFPYECAYFNLYTSIAYNKRINTMKFLNLLPKKNRFMSMGLALLASATLLSSCLKNDSEDYQGPVAGISFMHAAAIQPSVTLLVDGRAIFNSAIQYGASSQYLTAGAGNHLVQTFVGGTTQKFYESTEYLAE